jgi:hypothetical protein
LGRLLTKRAQIALHSIHKVLLIKKVDDQQCFSSEVRVDSLSGAHLCHVSDMSFSESHLISFNLFSSIGNERKKTVLFTNGF